MKHQLAFWVARIKGKLLSEINIGRTVLANGRTVLCNGIGLIIIIKKKKHKEEGDISQIFLHVHF